MRSRTVGEVVPRAAGLLLVWIVLGRTGPADLAAGAIVAVALAFASIRIAPPFAWKANIGGLARYASRFLRGSLTAGVEVARRVLSADMRLRPAILRVPCPVPAGAARQAFCAVASLQPGTLPLVEDGDGEGDTLRVHVLDADGPVAAQVTADARAFLSAGQVAA